MALLINLPPHKTPGENTYHNAPDFQRPPLGMHEEETWYQKYDFNGNVTVCQMPFNRWIRCRRANPASFDTTLVCHKHHEDFIECTYAFKKKARDKRAKELWKEYEERKSQGTLPKNLNTPYRPLFCE